MSEVRDRARKKIREEIAKRIYTDWNKDPKYTWETLPEYRKQSYRDWVDEDVLELIASEEAKHGFKGILASKKD